MNYAQRIENGPLSDEQRRPDPAPSTRRIAEAPATCFDPSHAPPSFQLFEPGTYEHRCPSCGHLTYFTVRAIRA